MKSVFITGGTGFFGKSMLDYRLRHPDLVFPKWTILSRDPERFIRHNSKLACQTGVKFCKGDVRNFDFGDEQYDAVIHAATEAVTTLANDEMMSVIVEGTARVIAFAKSRGVQKIMLTSSGAVYGPQIAMVSEDAECHPVTAYGCGKLQAERLCVESGLQTLIARCFAFTGPYLNRSIHYAIGNFIRDCLEGRPIVINGDGTPHRSYLYADDLVEWLLAILMHGESGRPYNVGSAEAVSIRELAERVKDALGVKNKISVLGTPQPAPPSVYVPVVSRIERELGVRQRVSLSEAIRRSAR